MLVNVDGKKISTDTLERNPMGAADLGELFIFDPEVILTPLNAKTICEAVARMQFGTGTEQSVIDSTALDYYNYGLKEGIRKSGDMEHIYLARQVIKDFLVTADYIYKMLAEFEQPQIADELAEYEDGSTDG